MSTSEFYDRNAGSWWDPHGMLRGMGTMLNPVRVPYFSAAIAAGAGGGARVLDVGCGGGLLSAALAALGFSVTGVDPSRRSVAAARANTTATYVAGLGERLPFADASYDAAVVAEVLEHAADAGGVVDEAARVLRPGGVICFAGPNRTTLSRLALIDAAQRWRATRVLPADLHEWERFVRPSELRSMLAGNGVEVREVVGVGLPIRRFGRAVITIAELRRGAVSHADAGRRLALTRVRSTQIAYQGYGIKI